MLSIGNNLVGNLPPINPFQMDPGARAAPAPAVPGGTLPDNPPEPPEQHTEKLQGWKNFIQRVKTDPDMKMAMLQFAIGLSQPAHDPAAGVGQALSHGLATLTALQDRRTEQARQAAADQRAERTVAIQEGGLEEERLRGTRADSQFGQKMSQDRAELEARWKQIGDTAEYQKGLLEVERLKANNKEGGEAGAVNARWSRLRDSLLADPSPALLAISDPVARRARANNMAFDLINHTSQDQAKFIAKYLADQQLFLPQPEKDPKGYAEGMQRLIQQAGALAEGAHLENPQAAPSGPPASQTPPPTQAAPPVLNEIRKGPDGDYQFLGGDWAKPSSWKKVK